MRDINFFSFYIDKRKSARKKHIIIYSSIFIIAGGLIGFYIWNNNKIEDLNKDLQRYEELFNSKEMTLKINEAETKRQKIEVLTQYEVILQTINGQIDLVDRINSQIINDIASSMPKEMYILNANINQVEINLQGVASNRILIAEWIHNLKEFPYLASVHANIIAVEDNENNNQVFDIKCTFKDGAADNE